MPRCIVECFCSLQPAWSCQSAWNWTYCLVHDVGDNNKNGVFFQLTRKPVSDPIMGTMLTVNFDILTFRFIEGDMQNALVEPYSIVLSKSLADNCFRKESRSGKQSMERIATLTWPEYMRYTGKILSDTSLPDPDEDLYRPTSWKDYEDNYWAYSFYTMLLLKPSASPQSVDAKIYDALKGYRKEHHPYLRPLSKTFSESLFSEWLYLILSLYSFIALLILLLSAINFINLPNSQCHQPLSRDRHQENRGFTKGSFGNNSCLSPFFLPLFQPWLVSFLHNLPYLPSTAYWCRDHDKRCIWWKINPCHGRCARFLQAFYLVSIPRMHFFL